MTQDLAEQFADLRPELFRYCARLTGSVFEAEDIVQDTLERALAHPPAGEIRPWLFRVAHNRAVDHLRASKHRRGEPLDELADQPDETTPAPDEAAIRRETVSLAIARFTELPIAQRSVVILKDVLDHSLTDIAELLDFSLAAVKAALHRGRARLRELAAAPQPAAPRPSAEIARYVAMFNGRDWQGLRALLADDVKLNQSAKYRKEGRTEVGQFFGIYGDTPDWHLWPAWLEGREIVAVFGGPEASSPAYFMEIFWRDGEIALIHDRRYLPYEIEGAEILLAGG